jgi:hypothetical protein
MSCQIISIRVLNFQFARNTGAPQERGSHFHGMTIRKRTHIRCGVREEPIRSEASALFGPSQDLRAGPCVLAIE